MQPAPRTSALAIACSVLGLALPGLAPAQTATSAAHPAAASAGIVSGNVSIDPNTGVVTAADGTTSVLAPGTTVIVLPSAGSTSIGAGNLISGVVVPAGLAQVAALLSGFAGSTANLARLEAALRTRTPVTLTGAAGNVTLVPPVGPLTADGATQALLLASSQLNALGITQPTPQQIQASLTGGTVTSAAGQAVALPGVLQQRSRGLSFAQIAQGVAASAATGQAPADTRIGARERAVGASVAQGARAGHPAGASAGGTLGASGGFAPSTAPRGNPNATGGFGLR